MRFIFHSQEKSGGLYVIRNLLNGWVYLGSTVKFKGRFLGHQRSLKRGTHRNKGLQADFNRYGAGAFSCEVVAVMAEEGERIRLEEKSIEGLFGSDCYNATVVCPPSTLGRKLPPFSEEHRLKLRLAHLGKKRGKRPPRSEEHRRKLRLAGIGRKLSEEAKRKVQAANLGKKLSEDTKKKIGDFQRLKETRAKNRSLQLGRKRSQETCEKLRQAGLGRQFSEASKEKNRLSHLGKRASEETREKMRRAHANRKPISEETRGKLRLARRKVVGDS